MTETAPEAEPLPAVPEPTDIERVAQLAAEAATRTMPDPDGARLAAVEQALGEITKALALAASPEGNAARISARLDALDQAVAALRSAPAPAHPVQQKTIDDLRLKTATIERELKRLGKDTP